MKWKKRRLDIPKTKKKLNFEINIFFENNFHSNGVSLSLKNTLLYRKDAEGHLFRRDGVRIIEISTFRKWLPPPLPPPRPVILREIIRIVPTGLVTALAWYCGYACTVYRTRPSVARREWHLKFVTERESAAEASEESEENDGVDSVTVTSSRGAYRG